MDSTILDDDDAPSDANVSTPSTEMLTDEGDRGDSDDSDDEDDDDDVGELEVREKRETESNDLFFLLDAVKRWPMPLIFFTHCSKPKKKTTHTFFSFPTTRTRRLRRCSRRWVSTSRYV